MVHRGPRAGILYIADWNNNDILSVTPSAGRGCASVSNLPPVKPPKKDKVETAVEKQLELIKRLEDMKAKKSSKVISRTVYTKIKVPKERPSLNPPPLLLAAACCRSRRGFASPCSLSLEVFFLRCFGISNILTRLGSSFTTYFKDHWA